MRGVFLKGGKGLNLVLIVHEGIILQVAATTINSGICIVISGTASVETQECGCMEREAKTVYRDHREHSSILSIKATRIAPWHAIVGPSQYVILDSKTR